MAMLNTLALSGHHCITKWQSSRTLLQLSFSKELCIKKPDPVTRVLLRLIHRASRDIRRPRQQLAMRDELGEGFDVEDAGADHWAVLVGSKGAT